MPEFRFSHPWLLLLLLIPPALAAMHWLGRSVRRSAVPLPALGLIPRAHFRAPTLLRIQSLLRALALCCLAPVAAGLWNPMHSQVPVTTRSALVIVLDVSSSMTAADFTPQNRLEAAKRYLQEYIKANPGLEIGLIQLAAAPRLLVPVTGSRDALLRSFETVGAAGFGEDGTAIGSGIASAVNRLRGGPWRRRRILLITDGVNNRGPLAPLDAARLARALDVRIDAIGIGTDSISRFWAPSAGGAPVELEAKIDIDDKALEDVTGETGGAYRRVRNSEELRRALLESGADRPETAVVPVTAPDTDLLQMLAGAGLLFAVVELVIREFVSAELPG